MPSNNGVIKQVTVQIGEILGAILKNMLLKDTQLSIALNVDALLGKELHATD